MRRNIKSQMLAFRREQAKQRREIMALNRVVTALAEDKLRELQWREFQKDMRKHPSQLD